MAQRYNSFSLSEDSTEPATRAIGYCSRERRAFLQGPWDFTQCNQNLHLRVGANTEEPNLLTAIVVMQYSFSWRLDPFRSPHVRWLGANIEAPGLISRYRGNSVIFDASSPPGIPANRAWAEAALGR